MRSAAFTDALRARLAARGLDRADRPASSAYDEGPSPFTADVPVEQLSAGERRLWTLAQIDPDDVSHVIGIVWWFTSDRAVDAHRLASSVSAATAAEPVLRSVITDAHGEPSWIDAPSLPRVRVVDGDRDLARESAREMASTAFDLRAEPPWRAEVIDLPGGRAAVAFAAHHVAVDDRSWEVLLNAILDAYDGALPDRRLRRRRPPVAAERIRQAAELADRTVPGADVEFVATASGIGP
ncbi:condensation domain-containing protein, partial [Gordonia sp. (in: high G+C Gram-positive bacteria)]|uniref:condensation domain-containing protein n=1 Tax=Gordonia sp. (in: high G+C Gram-positive bacteria) TaxID=84139 RepID=UPI003F9D73F0